MKETVALEVLREEVLRGRVWRRMGRYRQVELHAYCADGLPRPFVVTALLRMFSRGRCVIVSRDGSTTVIGVGSVLGRLIAFIRDTVSRGGLLREASRALDEVDTEQHVPTTPGGHPLYLRTDLAYGIASGGSVGHIAGVLNHLDRFTTAPVFVSSDRIPTVREDIETHIATGPSRYMDFAELPEIAHNTVLVKAAMNAVADRKVGFVYQRYSRFNFTGLVMSRRLKVPCVLEYNGSEVWIAKQWGNPLKYQAIAERIELANLRRADVVVVVSDPMKDELVGRGIDTGRILVNPNGVDTDRYCPHLDGGAIREAHGLGGKTVVGFIGTFGAWHGSEVLAEAFGRLLDSHPAMRDEVRLLMIGDGPKMPMVREALAKFNAEDASVLAGLVPQSQGPAYLAACDILVSPHVPNSDGTPFFGSPTKLFEYMSMGKGIVASDLDQIGQVLQHDKTAWLVKPGDASALAEGIATLVSDAARRRRLGEAARLAAVERHTWLAHTSRIIEKLRATCG